MIFSNGIGLVEAICEKFIVYSYFFKLKVAFLFLNPFSYVKGLWKEFEREVLIPYRLAQKTIRKEWEGFYRDLGISADFSNIQVPVYDKKSHYLILIPKGLKLSDICACVPEHHIYTHTYPPETSFRVVDVHYSHYEQKRFHNIRTPDKSYGLLIEKFPMKSGRGKDAFFHPDHYSTRMKRRSYARGINAALLFRNISPAQISFGGLTLLERLILELKNPEQIEDDWTNWNRCFGTKDLEKHHHPFVRINHANRYYIGIFPDSGSGEPEGSLGYICSF